MKKKLNVLVSAKPADKKVKHKVIPSAPCTFPIIGIGASAGGLEALEQFLRNVPLKCAMAFIVVQHLDPNHQGIMCELLQRITPMKVLQITDCLAVKPDHVYVIPPAFDLTIMNGILHLLDRVEPRGLHLPINYFFNALAADKKQQSIAVILSGMGSDGTLGVRAIKDNGGAVFVQTPSNAKFDGMPKSAINAKLVDVIAPADKLMASIVNYVKHVPLLLEDDTSGIEKVMVLLRAHTGHDFSLYKKSTIYRRVERRMALHQLAKVTDYVRYLRCNDQECELLFKELLIGVTNFFRDKKVWLQLQTEVIPQILSHYPDGGTLRAWVPACSTGEEPYTLAMVFLETLKAMNIAKNFALQIFATDLDNEAVSKARAGLYPKSIEEHVSKALLARYFVQVESGYKITKTVREMVIFAPQNLVMDPPFTKLDILSCRNLLIYHETDLQKRLFPLFHYSLNTAGVLVLGTAETVGNDDKFFTALPGKQRIYRRRDNLLPIDLMKFPTTTLANYNPERIIDRFVTIPPQSAPTLNLEQLTHTLLQEHFAPAALLTTDKGDIVYINGKTGQYLEPAAGKVNHNLFAMARYGLAAPLNEVFNRAVRQKEKLTLRNIKVGTNEGTQQVDVSVHPLASPAEIKGLVLVLLTMSAIFSEPIKTDPKGDLGNGCSQEIAALKLIVAQLREELRKTSEEMQSMNEELQTVNHELSTKVYQLSEASDDMKNLLNSTDIATLFLDSNLKVRRFTTQTNQIFKLIPSDVGRPITDLVSSLIYASLADDAREVLRSLIFKQLEVATVNKRWYIVRIMPYRTQDNRIDGVVITFTDNTINRNATIAMTESECRFRLLFENSPNAVAYKKIIIKNDKAVDFSYLEVNNAFSGITGFANVAGKNGSEIMPNILQSNAEFMAVCGRVAMTGVSEKIEYYVKKNKQWFSSAMYSQEKGLLVCVTENITVKKQNISTLDDIQALLQQGECAPEADLRKMLMKAHGSLEKLLLVK